MINVTEKFKPKEIYLSKNKGSATMIVGQCPGHQRKKEHDLFVLSGNRIGDLLAEGIGAKINIYMTNVFNDYYPEIKDGKYPEAVVKEGKEQLIRDINRVQPKKIICLGTYALKHATECVKKCKVKRPTVVMIPHPSYIIRFNKDRNKWKQQLQKEL